MYGFHSNYNFFQSLPLTKTICNLLQCVGLVILPVALSCQGEPLAASRTYPVQPSLVSVRKEQEASIAWGRWGQEGGAEPTPYHC